jgi:RNA polymerase-interacting CarD/CdnL/TRCF family regulator
MTETNNIFSIGDYIIDFENIYQISSQKKQKDFSGKILSYFFYKPIKKTNQNETTYSTPIDNILKSGLRHLIEQSTIKKLYKDAEEKINSDIDIDYKSIKEILYQNDPNKSLVILKQLFFERGKFPDNFSRTNKEILESVLEHISNEIAFVTKKPIEKIQEKLSNLVQKSIKSAVVAFKKTLPEENN